MRAPLLPTIHHPAIGCLLALLLVLPACQTDDPALAPDATGRGAMAGGSAPRMGDGRRVEMGTLSEIDQRDFRVAWGHFVNRSAVWPLYLEQWLGRGGAAPYVLSENLFGYFWRAALSGKTGELSRIAETARVIGEPAVAYFAKALVTDSWPLKTPITTEVMDPDDLNGRIKKTFTRFIMDDETRRWAAGVIAEVGAAAVPTLASDQVLRQAHPTSRRYAAFALGRIGTPAAIEALTTMLQRGATWQDRAAAATGLGLNVETSPRAREVLLQAADNDKDRFVRRKANRALASADPVKFW